MFTRKLLRHFFTFSLFALMLLPQSSAFAAGISAVPSPPSLTDTDCLNVSNSTTFNASVVPATSPPGQEVSYEAVLSVTNLCTADNPVSNIKVLGTVTTTCAGQSTVDKPAPLEYPFKGTLDNGKSATENATAFNRCIISVDNVPTTSVVPATIAIELIATGKSASGQLVTSPRINLNVK